MEKSIVAVEESRERNESSAYASKCSGRLVQINSIAIDINCAMEMEDIEPPKHEHFSIRGFVADMRRKDRKKCLPFVSEVDDDDHNDDDGMDLPPLSVPDFRWWQCSECVPYIADQISTQGLVLPHKSDDAGTSSCHNVEGADEHGLIVHDIDDEHGSRDSRDGDYSYPDDKLIDFSPRCTEEHKAVTNVRDNETGTSCTHITEANPIEIQETHNNAADASTVEPENTSSGSDDNIAFSTLPPKRKPKLRSLADIINEENILTNEQPRTKSSQIEADLNPQPELEDSFDAARSTKIPQRKRKNIVLEDDRESPETNPPIFSAKRLKGSVIEARNNKNTNNNTCKRTEISESDSESDRPAPLDLRINGKTQPNKPRKHKALHIHRKPTTNTVQQSADLPKYPVAAEGSSGNIGPFFRHSLFGQEMGSSSSDVSKGQRPEESEYFPYMPNVQERVALDLSLSSYVNSGNQESSGKYTGIPDLNESFVEKTSMMEGQQVPSLHEMSFTLHENLDMHASSSVVSKQQQTNTILEHGVSSDDIPMEIVELLAKNQRERAIDNSRRHLGPVGINNSFKGSPYYVESRPVPINFPYANRDGQGFLNFPMPKNCRLDIGNSDKSQFRRFSPLTPSQQRILPLYSGPNSMSRPRTHEGADLLWPPRRKSVTFDLSGTPNCSIQSNGLEDQSYTGKHVGPGRENDVSLVKEGKIGPGRESVGSADAYSNDTIPAMQLLSLMDQGIVTGSSFKVGPGKFLDRRFSPCNHHPRPSRNDNINDPFVSSSSLFAESSRTNKDFPSSLNVVRYSGDSSKKSILQGHMPPHKVSSKDIDLAGPSNTPPQPSRSDLKLEVCTLNRNPADFSIPDAKNEFTICGKDLKRKRRDSSKERGRPANVEGPKRQKVIKDPARKESSRK